MLLLRPDASLALSALRAMGLAVGGSTGEEDTVLDKEGPGILVAKAIDTTPGVYTFSKKRQQVSCLVEEQRSVVGLETLRCRGAFKRGHFPLHLSRCTYHPSRPAGVCLLSRFLDS